MLPPPLSGAVPVSYTHLDVYKRQALEETRGFLNRAYSGSLGLMVDAMVNSRSLSDQMCIRDSSLPDGWGRLLVDRFMQKNHVDPKTLGNLERLAIVGATGMGALSRCV